MASVIDARAQDRTHYQGNQRKQEKKTQLLHFVREWKWKWLDERKISNLINTELVNLVAVK